MRRGAYKPEIQRAAEPGSDLFGRNSLLQLDQIRHGDGNGSVLKYVSVLRGVYDQIANSVLREILNKGRHAANAFDRYSSSVRAGKIDA